MADKLVLLGTWCLTGLWSSSHACPELCVCQDKYSHQFADCAYKNFASVPDGLPHNVTTLSLSANKIKSLLRSSFVRVPQVTSLWLAHNEISTIEEGTLAPLSQLKNLDISHNQIARFPWQDLYNLTALQLLKMNNNLLAGLPGDAFSTLGDLRSLRINSNRFRTFAEGTFDSLTSLSHLQIYSNPFSCTCQLEWLKDWIHKALISIPEKQDIQCSDPPELRGTAVVDLPPLQCSAPLVYLSYQGSKDKAGFFEGQTLSVHCNSTGNPLPQIRWKVQTANREIELNEAKVREEGRELATGKEDQERLVVLKNGTLVIPRLTKYEEGVYTCLATNIMGSNESSLQVVLSPTSKRDPVYTKEPALSPGATLKPGVKDHGTGLPKLRGVVRSPEPTVGGIPTRRPVPGAPDAQSCVRREGSRYISNHAFNQSSEMKRHTFDFGVIALEVSESDARVQLTPFQSSPRAKSPQMLYLCSGQGVDGASVVQWSMIESGVNSYRFQNLRPGSNYTLCFTYTGQDCQVQVVFTTRRKIPSLLIMVVVSCFLLGLATVPLLGATCCHLMYKYQGKTYKLIMKTQAPEKVEKEAASPFEAAASSLHGSAQVYEPSEAGGASLEAEGISESHVKTNQEEYEICSEYSDRLPLGAEAVNINQEINGNYRRPVR
ncbi:immunoglobulin superfamily containing leucine-rich repeat protein 2 [Pristis pectinata]|uniref:immunoglobulin superfamily containing leucine-rich repeat protein 2 n=1 Tax=Pristis pectinata TaxID=685728 RepID=UPI00223E7DBC|nr:immunoglobulin superfamily containing leucine-rich repeat protein 2 [Pristis pectinata]XP_051898681.1 immunoglobulin superfamily containing leucine-rich repeat protein 2 [Pristis pectinata]